MEISIALISILAIAGAVWMIGRVSSVKICPVCAGVSGTWIWMLVVMSAGLFPTSDFRLLTSILMGGSVVGVAYQLEKSVRGDMPILLWKILFIPAGFVGVYGFITGDFKLFLFAAVFLVLLFVIFIKSFARHAKGNQTVEELKDKMSKCC